jgi:hypothetical protein
MKIQTIQKTKILPLRWIGNIFGDIAATYLQKALHYDDHGFAYRYYSRMWIILNKPYKWWGTYYELDMKDLYE